MQRLGAVVESGEQRRVDGLGEDVHRHVDEHRPGLAVLGEQERLLDDLGQQLRLVDAPGPLDERPIDLVLRGVGVQVDLLVRVPAVVVGGHVAGDHHHGDAIEGGVGHAGGGVGEARAEVAEHDRGPSGDTRVAIGCVGGDLFVADVDELDAAAGHGGEDGDVGVPAQAEDVADTAPFQIADELFGGGRVGALMAVLLWLVQRPHRSWADAGGRDRSTRGSSGRSSASGVIVWRSSLAWARIPARREAMNRALPRSLGKPDLVEDGGHGAVDVDRHRLADRTSQRRLERWPRPPDGRR